jgi:patatin-related protein
MTTTTVPTSPAATVIPAAPPAHPPGDLYAPEQELRLAVVMYGGVSLAIYMNGVAQELLNLVIATAPEPDRDDGTPQALLWPEAVLPGTARVYRKLGKIVGNKGLAGQPLGDALQRDQILQNEPVRTRFVIDILSGTSAGGINGIFLAKALANQQSMDLIQQLWISEGDFSRLLNDERSWKDNAKWAAGGSPESLLNSKRIYTALLDALQGMSPLATTYRDPRDEVSSPYVEELDLYVTTTDVCGLLTPIRLADRMVYERRYRNYFHFRYGFQDYEGAEYNDLQDRNSPFLAYSARCTSAFPFAFEPMSLGTAQPLSGYSDDDLKYWERFYADYLCAASNKRTDLPFENRYFIDGGCLDNKPFSYAIEALTWRRADVPVKRKLFYVEPSPAHPESSLDLPAGAKPDDPHATKPDALGSVNAGYMDLPRVENIQEDLRRLLERNRTVQRIEEVVAQVDQDVANLTVEEDVAAATDRWVSASLQELMKNEGPAYAAYHKLKVAAVTDTLAKMVACAAGLDPDSDDVLAVRMLVKAWRGRNFDETWGKEGCQVTHTKPKFLLSYDLDYRIRRLTFVRRKIDAAFRSASDLEERRRLRRTKRLINEVRRGMLRRHALLTTTDKANPLRETLDKTQKDLREALARAVVPPPPGEAGAASGVQPENAFETLVRKILGHPVHDDSNDTLVHDPEAEAGKFYELYADILAPVMVKLQALIDLPDQPFEVAGLEAGTPPEGLGTRAASKLARTLLTDSKGSGSDGCGVALLHYFETFEQYDKVIFPVMYGTNIGEPKVVEVIRVSPEDASRIYNQTTKRKSKLAGDSLGHFGGFLDALWREHDVLWGRLDGVERIIDGLAPELARGLRDSLVEEAHEAVLQEWFKQTPAEARQMLAEMKSAERPPVLPRVETDAPDQRPLTKAHVLRSAKVGAAEGLGPLPNKAAVDIAARSSKVVGRMMEDISWKHGLKHPWVSIPAKIGAAASHVVEVATPGSLKSLFTKHILVVIYLLEALLIAGGIVANNRYISAFGWQALGVTAAFNIVVFFLECYMSGWKVRPGLARLASYVIALFAVLALVTVVRHFGEDVVGYRKAIVKRVKEMLPGGRQ